MRENSHELKFRVSTALKNIIGRDLINDRFIAVFELVKNCYDAGAHSVTIRFENLYSANAKIIISDDGCGMSLDDIENKWLFVAYSEKRHIEDYRDKIKRKVAGAKGVGRFSCDRLGAKLTLITKPSIQDNANKVFIDWNKFEADDTRDFVEIDVEHIYIKDLPNQSENGTVLEIAELREKWKRADLLYLKRSLMKLVNPQFEDNKDQFNVYIDALDEYENDNKEKNINDLVNGRISNDVFEKLNIKTTSLSVTISQDGKEITTALFDRGEFIFQIIEVNKYNLLRNIECSIFYLSTTAKTNFTRLMGVEPVNYGSIFIYKNGFRVYPYGEPGKDFLDIDRRKAQGQRRYLGTRELMGRVQIIGDSPELTETTSRDGGFIKTDTLEQLSTFFVERVLRVLEKYVVEIIVWGEPSKEEQEKGITEGIQPSQVIDKIVDQFAGFARRREIINVQYNSNIISYIDRLKEKSLEGSLQKLERIAQKSNNEALLTLARDVKKDSTKLYKQKVEAERESEITRVNLEKAKNEIELRKKQNFFLKDTNEKNVEYLLGGMHLLFTYSDAMKNNIQFLTEKLLMNTEDVSSDIKDVISEISITNQKINKISEYAIKGNFALKSDTIKSDILEFVIQYAEVIKNPKIKVSVKCKDEKSYYCSFDVSSIGIIIDNIVSNSIKADARNLLINVSDDNKNIILSFKDDGKGLNDKISNAEMLFELGVTTTSGFGMGLYHIKQMVEEMDGSIDINKENNSGFEVIVRVKK